MIDFGNDWQTLLKPEFESDYYLKLRDFLKEEYSCHTVYPDMYDIFNAFKYTSYSDVKIVILGQDPYHQPGQAHGLAFSVKQGINPPPSLVNIYKELKSDLGIDIPSHGCLQKWAKQGVLLLNTSLTVRAGEPMSHKNHGWEIFTDSVIKILNNRSKPIIFMLWGSFARSKKILISSPPHFILEAAHPSPLSAYNGFFGCKHFSKANEILKSIGVEPIDWEL